MSEVPSWLSDDNNTNNAATPPNHTTSSAASWMNDDTTTTTPSRDVQGVVLDLDHQVVIIDDPRDTEAPPTTPATPAPTATPPRQSWGDFCWSAFQRDGRLLLITLLIIILMNIPFVQFVFYPFTIFSTWIHEVCHGMAALLVGGSISKLEIFADTSGLAYTAVPGDRRGFVISAGYQGTAVTGCLMLMVRRTKRGPRTCMMGMALWMVLSVLLWIRNPFGIVFILILGLALVVASWRLTSTWMRNVYLFFAITTTMNAITSVRTLFGSNHMVNGKEFGTDAHSMADFAGGTHTLWAMIWLFLGLILMLLGVVFAIPGPDEVADFSCCGVCQDLGLFKCFNYPGQRLFGRMVARQRNGSTATSTEGGAAGGGVDVSA